MSTTIITDEQWEKIDEKYTKLMRKVAHWISGDIAIASHDDNYADVQVAALEAVRGYSKKENQPFDEFWGSIGFDKYIKTCLWNLKNNKGARITKRYPITKRTVTTFDNEEFLELTNDSAGGDENFLEEFSSLVTDEQYEVVKLVIEDPSYLKPSGKINVSKLSKALNLSWYDADNVVKDLSYSLENEF